MTSTETFETLVSSFVSSVIASDLTGDVLENMDPQRSEEDMFSYLWSLKEAHQSLTPTLASSEKSYETAESFLRRGDEALKQGHLQEALRSFNAGVMSAPTPFMVEGAIGDRNNNFDGFLAVEEVRGSLEERDDLLSRCYEGRSEVFHNAGDHDKCMMDLENALKLCVDEKRREELEKKREECVGRMKQKGNRDVKWKVSCQEVPALKERHPCIPSFSNAVRLAFTPSQGRFLVADRDIRPGEVVCVEESYCSSLYTRSLLTHCCVCLARSFNPLPCLFCATVIFCSEACRADGLNGSHWQECTVLPTFVALDMGVNSLLAYRIMIHTSYSALKAMLPTLEQEASVRPPETIGFDESRKYVSSSYRPVYHLVTNRKERSPTDLLRRCIQAFVVTKLLVRSGRYFITERGIPFSPSHKDIILAGSTLMHHLMNLLCNAYAIGELQMDLWDYTQCKLVPRAGGVFVASSLLNHSCNPSTAAFSHDRIQVLRAVRHIKAGDPLTYNYGIFYCSENEDTRRAKLLKQYNFTCACEACENKWYSEFNRSSVLILSCSQCSAKSHPDCACECSSIRRRLERTASSYDAIYKKILQGSVTDGDIGQVIEMIELMDKHVEMPCRTYFDAQELLKFYFDTKGSCVLGHG